MVSPSCGHRLSGVQRRGIKKALARARVTTIAGGRKAQDSAPPQDGEDEHRGPVRGPTDAENLRAVAPPFRASDTGITDATFRTVPALTWEPHILTILELETFKLNVEDVLGRFNNLGLWEGSNVWHSDGWHT